jgi:predicted nucleotidyltransferase
MAQNKEQITARVKEFITSLGGAYPVHCVYLFGSWAEDRAGEYSDVDIGVILDKPVSLLERQELFALGKEYDLDFDVLAVSKADFETEDPVIVHEMKQKGIRVA